MFVLGTTALSVILAWLWQRTGGSLLLTMLLHASWNNSKDIVPSGVARGAETFGIPSVLHVVGDAGGALGVRRLSFARHVNKKAASS